MICNPCRSPILVREVQPPHIYVRGDGRLKLSKQSTTYQYNLLFSSNPCSCFRCPAISPRFRRRSKTELRAAKSGLVQPIVAGFLRRGFPRGWGVWCQKRRLTVLRIALEAGLPRGELRSISPGTAGTRGRVRVTRFERNTLLATPLGTIRSKNWTAMTNSKTDAASISTDNIIKPTLEKLSEEQRQGLEAWKKKRDEEFESLRAKWDQEDQEIRSCT